MNICTIDFDWIMWPVINAYNDMVPAKMDAPIQKLRDEVRKMIPGVDLRPDWPSFQKIKSICEIYQNRLYKIEDHGEIVDLCKEPCDFLINIDHHHDYYKGDGLTYDCSNWVRVLERRKLFKQYIWVPSKSSVTDLDKKSTFFTASPEPMETLRKYKIDKVILCESPQWLSTECSELWEMFTSTLDFLNKE